LLIKDAVRLIDKILTLAVLFCFLGLFRTYMIGLVILLSNQKFSFQNTKPIVSLHGNVHFFDIIQINEVSTRHDMNYGQIGYPTLVVKLINVTKAEPLFGT
jgi:hypothetical protein